MTPRVFSTRVVIGLLEVLLPSIAESAQFPSGLLGKSVTTVSSGSLVFRNDLNQTFTAVSNNRLQIYISSAGRVFTKWRSENVSNSLNNRRPSGQVWENQQAPDGSASSELQKITVHFERGALVADSLMVTGARRFLITFDPSYSNCNLRIIWGKERGIPVRTRSVFSGRILELLSAKPAKPPACSVTSGNVFAGR
jgi:hypothetical protein